MATYNVVAVQRTPQSSGVPTLQELGPLEASFDYTDILNEAPEGIFRLDVDSLQGDIKTSLLDPVAQPLEVWVYRESLKVFAGPLVGHEIKDDLLTIAARGAEFYTAYMLVETDKTWAAVDEFTIATDLIDDWQVQTYGHYGIITSGIGTSGTTRSLVIPGAEEPRVVYEILAETIAQDFGVDFWVDPTDGELKLGTRGSDLTASVFLELGVKSSAVRLTVSPGNIASEVFATSTGGETILTTSKSNATLRASWGRAGTSLTVDDDPDATTLGDAAQAHLDDRSDPFFIPGPELIPVAGAGVEDFNVGDQVAYTFDAGLGQQTGGFKVRKRKVAVGHDGQETMAVEFV
jgi:hypothetical protein